jgi:hypothetical protein
MKSDIALSNTSGTGQDAPSYLALITAFDNRVQSADPTSSIIIMVTRPALPGFDL